MQKGSDAKRKQCNECGKCFSKSANLVLHLRSHTGERPFSCNECGKAFKSKGTLNNHQIIHTGEKPFPCTICGQSFPYQTSLRRHSLTHKGERSYACKICDRTYLTDSALASHVKTHIASKSCTCDLCPKRFASLDRLRRHVSTVHLKVKPFLCDWCGKKYTHNYLLAEHLQTHSARKSGERHHKCEICGRRFFVLPHLKKHLFRWHLTKSSPSSVCSLSFATEDELNSHFCEPEESPAMGVNENEGPEENKIFIKEELWQQGDHSFANELMEAYAEIEQECANIVSPKNYDKMYSDVDMVDYDEDVIPAVIPSNQEDQEEVEVDLKPCVDDDDDDGDCDADPLA